MECKQLELNIISAQDLKKPRSFFSGKLKTYAVAWICRDQKISTRIDCTDGVNPTWNDKLILRIEDRFLQSHTSALTVDIYSVGRIKDTLLGSVRVLISNLAKGDAVNFCAIQVRRPSGRPQGILNIASAILDGKNSGGVAHLQNGNVVYHKGNSEDHWTCVKKNLPAILKEPAAIVSIDKSELGVDPDRKVESQGMDDPNKFGVGCYPSLRRNVSGVGVVLELER